MRRRAAGPARRQNAAGGGPLAGDGRRGRRGSRRPRRTHAAVAPRRIGRRQLEPLGLQPLGAFHRPRAPGGRRPGHPTRPRRLGRPLQSGDRRGPGDAGLYGRTHLDRGGGRAPADCPRKAGRRPLALLSRRELPQPLGGSRRQGPGPLHPRHPHHAAARPDGSIRVGGLSARAGRRPFEPVDERQRGDLRRPSGERRPPPQRQAAGDEHSGSGDWAWRRGWSRLPSGTANRGR